MSSTTSLLLLLDSILSQEPGRIRQARTRIAETLEKAGITPNSFAGSASSAGAASTLVQDVEMLLSHFPNLASISSSHDGSLPLHFAASIGNVQVAHLLLRAYPQGASTPNSKGKIPLHYAAREGRSEMVAFFLYHCPQTATITSKKQKLALHFAAGDGHTEVVRQLLRVHPQGASLPSAKGKLPLHFAARWGHVQIASDLLFYYPEAIRCIDWDGSLPLHDAAREGQLVMSRFLIERYPAGLSVANIRSEIPLFPAVRSGNVDLVIMYLQGWSAGGMHILKSVRAVDNIQDWDWKIVELCLRGAVDNFSDCPLMEGKLPPAVCCPVLRDDAIISLGGGKQQKKGAHPVIMDACCARHERAQPFHPAYNSYRQTLPSPHYCQQGSTYPQAAHTSSPSAVTPLSISQKPSAVRKSDRCSSGSSGSTEDSFAAGTALDMLRSKSPILDKDTSRCKKRASEHNAESRKKRSRYGSWTGVGTEISPFLQQRKFIALHAALVCGGSSHVIRCVLNKFPDQVSEVDECGQLPLHLAVNHPSCSATEHESLVDNAAEQGMDKEEVLELVLNEIIKPYPGGALITDFRGRLPLHLALEARADFRLIQALVKANPSSAVDHIATGDARFRNKPPIYMATEYDCDLSTTYLLLRSDPSAVSEQRPT